MRSMMGVEWDEAKRLRNLADHGVDFRDAVLNFLNPVVEIQDDRREYGEVRIRALGFIDNDYFMVAYTWRKENRRIISAWRVDEGGKRRYSAILAQRP